ncbi:MAG: MarR family winged helix-turn-helix transcriptional regulator [Solirubrobacteraceae bacterium]
MDRDLSRSLHRLTARLDRAADRFLRAHAGVSYPRFLALYMVGAEGADTQRALAERLGVSEPSVSRLVRLLAEDGWLQAASEPGDGHRKRLRLTVAGDQLVQRWGGELEERLAALLVAAGVPYRAYRAHTHRLLTTLQSRVDGSKDALSPAAERSEL